ncbi:hypothetical protein K438DRAFT_1982278 [Mycena galopus ATCC 62051]|nr:hypothetical protein K438DRAFT_1983230 [Mycena galopus ATCC 62051]KAF8170997.1 hypothetical protein K438DRAFT_1982278 [Mycena galopus ATCC 62051]
MPWGLPPVIHHATAASARAIVEPAQAAGVMIEKIAHPTHGHTHTHSHTDIASVPVAVRKSASDDTPRAAPADATEALV